LFFFRSPLIVVFFSPGLYPPYVAWPRYLLRQANLSGGRYWSALRGLPLPGFFSVCIFCTHEPKTLFFYYLLGPHGPFSGLPSVHAFLFLYSQGSSTPQLPSPCPLLRKPLPLCLFRVLACSIIQPKLTLPGQITPLGSRLLFPDYFPRRWRPLARFFFGPGVCAGSPSFLHLVLRPSLFKGGRLFRFSPLLGRPPPKINP